MFALTLIIAAVLAAIRIAGHTSEAYQAIAHLFVGGLFAAAWVEYRCTWADGGLWGQDRATRGAMHKLYLALALSVVEVACALWFKFGAS